MSKNSKISYFGWSSFIIESERKKIIFDPFYRKFCGMKWSNLEDYYNAEIICISHGHAEHYVDLPHILSNSDAIVVGPTEVCSHLQTKYKIDKARLRPTSPSQPVEIQGFTITAFEWGHREVSYWNLFKKNLLKASVFEILRFGLLNFREAPATSQYFGFMIETPDKSRIMYYGEGFSDLNNSEQIRNLKNNFDPDILIAGMQLDFEKYVAQGVKILSPKELVLFHPHKALFEKIGLKSSPPEVFVDKIKQALPDVEISLPEPQSILNIKIAS